MQNKIQVQMLIPNHGLFAYPHGHHIMINFGDAAKTLKFYYFPHSNRPQYNVGNMLPKQLPTTMKGTHPPCASKFSLSIANTPNYSPSQKKERVPYMRRNVTMKK